MLTTVHYIDDVIALINTEGLVLVGKELPVLGQEVLLQMAAEVEGHVDNIAPCIYGGIQLGFYEGKRQVLKKTPLPCQHLANQERKDL